MTPANRMKLGDLFTKAAELAQTHESQVVRSIRHHLSTELTDPLTLTEEAEQALDAKLAAPTNRDFAQTIRVRSDTEPVRYEGEVGFKVILHALPQVTLSDCNGFELDLTGLDLALPPDGRPKFQLEIANCKNFVIRGGDITNARNICLIHGCETFRVTEVKGKRTEGYGLIIFDSRYFAVDRCSFHDGLASGIYCLGDTAYGRIEHNQCNGGRGFYNCDAGLHINHCTEDLGVRQVPEESHEARSILDKRKKPAFLFVRNNVFCNNRAQGIYCEGCTLSVFENNLIVENNKEGVCLDWGSALNLLRSNTIARNGARAKLSEAEVKADFIEHFPLLADGSCCMKLPGLSIDNGALNVIRGNQIGWNFGGGIKMVRTGVGNVILGNVIYENGIGANELIKHFHGVFLLSLGTGRTEFDEENRSLDFMPSELNLLLGNSIIGSSHHHAVYGDSRSTNNFVLDDNCLQCGDRFALSDNMVSTSLSDFLRQQGK